MKDKEHVFFGVCLDKTTFKALEGLRVLLGKKGKKLNRSKTIKYLVLAFLTFAPSIEYFQGFRAFLRFACNRYIGMDQALKILIRFVSEEIEKPEQLAKLLAIAKKELKISEINPAEIVEVYHSHIKESLRILAKMEKEHTKMAGSNPAKS